jgi:hypothetical protein
MTTVKYIDPKAESSIVRVRTAVDPDYIWFTDEELKHIMMVSGCELTRTIVRCFLGIQQRARIKNDTKAVAWARNQLTRYEVGFLVV